MTNSEQNISSSNPEETKTPTELLIEKVWEQLKLCYDPEIPINIVDLGFIYEVKADVNQDGKYDVYIRMTLTTPGCAMGGFIMDEAKNRVQSIAEVNEVKIELVFDPPWDRSKISMQAQLELGIF